MKDDFWRDAARGGVIVGIVVVAALYIKVLAGLGFIVSLLELFGVSYCVFALSMRRRMLYGADSYGRCMKFVLATMMLAGAFYGVGYYFLVNHFAVDFFTRQFEQVWTAMGVLAQPEAKRMAYKAMASPAYWVVYGSLAMVIYGGLVGLFVVTFVRKR